MKALLLIDLQADFLPGGALAVYQGDKVLNVARRAMADYEYVIASRDWHPKNHVSFATSHPGKQIGDIIEVNGYKQMLWPAHCVAHTPGVELSSELDIQEIDYLVDKGTDASIDSYSAFWDMGHLRSTGLADHLRAHAIDELVIMGLATDYCVKYTVLDALEEGFKVTVLAEGCRPVEAAPGDGARALDEMRQRGAEVMRAYA